jgi:SAM-dependent methyltransferase
MHDNSKLLFAKYALPFFGAGTRVLEVGPDGVPSTYEAIVRRERGGGGPAAWHTVDLATRPGMTHRAKTEYEFEIADGSYDVVLSGQVLEHVRKPWRWLPELARVCRSGGHVITISPVSWPYHEAPVDCWRIYPEGLRALHEEARLDVVSVRWESLEERGLLPRWPRPVSDHAPGFGYKLARLLHWPLARSFDAITIAKKPG